MKKGGINIENIVRKIMKTIYQKCVEILAVYSPTLATRVLYFKHFRKWLNLSKPRTLNEKILWLKLNTYTENPLVTECADKYRVRDYILSKGCPEILNELYFVWKSPEDICWELLPDKFVLKCNHGCGYNIICKDKSKLNKDEILIQLKKWQHEDFWKKKAEINYRRIEKRIICEKYLEGENRYRLNDYKVYCFNGKALFILLCIDDIEKRKFYFFDEKWNFLRINRDGLAAPETFYVKKPECLEKLLFYAERLASPFPFVRVDFYIEDERIIFGEMTFTPAAGLDVNRLAETDIFFGDLLVLPNKEHMERT